jgi:hypothetical protein
MQYGIIIHKEKLGYVQNYKDPGKDPLQLQRN